MLLTRFFCAMRVALDGCRSARKLVAVRCRFYNITELEGGREISVRWVPSIPESNQRALTTRKRVVRSQYSSI